MERMVAYGAAGVLIGLAAGVAIWWGVMGVDQSVQAQDTTQRTDVPKQDNGTEWSLNCANAQDGGTTDCQVSQVMTVKETGQRILMVVVKKDLQTLEPHVMLALPHKIFLPAGVIVQVDTQLPREMDIQTCDERACYATSRVSSGFLEFMRSGAAMHVTFQNLLHKPVTVSVPLSGFTVVYGELN